ncbi:MAG: fluoride ion transporter CrcB [Betaproteobacteria bacterium RIFCSPLOWO2_02_FULL_63_19]|nr:MAG: fluoride ion transporter CrcB [Betaproteobacteria bacterium RIFCSPLOWO2_02_FULL_63_19]
MSASAFAAVGVGAAFGAWLRWALGSALNPVFPTLPLGTLAANLLGGYLIGLAVAFFTANTSIPPEIRLLTITGFLGGLTTFSTFSAEAVTLLMRAQYGWGMALVLGHLAGSMIMTLLGIMTFNWMKG